MNNDRTDTMRNKDNAMDGRELSEYSNEYPLKDDRILHPKIPIKQEWAAMKRTNEGTNLQIICPFKFHLFIFNYS